MITYKCDRCGEEIKGSPYELDWATSRNDVPAYGQNINGELCEKCFTGLRRMVVEYVNGEAKP